MLQKKWFASFSSKMPAGLFPGTLLEIWPSLPPTPIQFFFGNPSLTWTEHSNHNNQQLLAMYRHNTHGILLLLLQNISTGLGLFWDDFPQNKITERDLDPPTHFHSNLGFLEKKILCKAPTLCLRGTCTELLVNAPGVVLCTGCSGG